MSVCQGVLPLSSGSETTTGDSPRDRSTSIDSSEFYILTVYKSSQLFILFLKYALAFESHRYILDRGVRVTVILNTEPNFCRLETISESDLLPPKIRAQAAADLDQLPQYSHKNAETDQSVKFNNIKIDLFVIIDS